MDGETVSPKKRKAKPLAAVLISHDERVRDSLAVILAAHAELISVEMEIESPLMEISDEELSHLRMEDPDLIFLDLTGQPHIGLKFAQYLAEATEVHALIGIGPKLDPDLLLSAMQSGITEYLPKPFQAEDLNAAIERISRRVGREVDRRERTPGKMYAVFSPKGGSGSTTLAVNLAVHMHRISRERTLVLDLDLELGETALLLGIEPRFSIVDLIRNFHRADSGLLASYIEQHESGVELLSAPIRPADVELVSEEQIRKILEFLKQHYDYVIVDTPKSFGPPTVATFGGADEILLLTAADLPSLRNVLRCLPLLRSRQFREVEERLRLVLNRYESRGMISADEVESMLGLEIYWKLRNDYDSVLLAANTGEPVVLTQGSEFARDVRALAADLAGVPRARETPRNLLENLLDRVPKGLPGIDLSRRKAAANE